MKRLIVGDIVNICIICFEFIIHSEITGYLYVKIFRTLHNIAGNRFQFGLSTFKKVGMHGRSRIVRHFSLSFKYFIPAVWRERDTHGSSYCNKFVG